jgi:hypothetical protein
MSAISPKPGGRDRAAILLSESMAELPPDNSDLVEVVIEYRDVLRQVLDETAPLAQIRLVLDSLDWETDDRQYALEQIDDILRDEATP